MTLTEQLIAAAGAYAKAKNLSEARVSTLVFNEGMKIDSIRKGADLGTKRFETAMQWFSDNWPPRTAWPKGVKRPEKVAA